MSSASSEWRMSSATVRGGGGHDRAMVRRPARWATLEPQHPDIARSLKGTSMTKALVKLQDATPQRGGGYRG